ncbi:hypothetical protein ES703_95632 [subsurface metagenome]
MKKILLTVFLAIFLIVGSVYAGPWCQQSAEYTDDAAVSTTSGVFHGILLVTDATYPVTLSIYDNASAASGTELIPTCTITTSSTNRLSGISIDPPVRYDNVIYVDISIDGAGSVTYMLYYEND